MQQIYCLLLKLNSMFEKDTDWISLVRVGILDWEKWEAQLFKQALKKYGWRGGAQEAGFFLETIVNPKDPSKFHQMVPDEIVCVCVCVQEGI